MCLLISFSTTLILGISFWPLYKKQKPMTKSLHLGNKATEDINHAVINVTDNVGEERVICNVVR